MLLNTDVPIINIALDLSYHEPINYFSKVFKKSRDDADGIQTSAKKATVARGKRRRKGNFLILFFKAQKDKHVKTI